MAGLTFVNFLTVFIGGVVAFTAWRQFHMSRAILQREMFDRRLALYHAVDTISRRILFSDLSPYTPVGRHSRLTVASDDFIDLERHSVEAKFVFNDDIRAHLETIIRHGYQILEENIRTRGHVRFVELQNPNQRQEGETALEIMRLTRVVLARMEVDLEINEIPFIPSPRDAWNRSRNWTRARFEGGRPHVLDVANRADRRMRLFAERIRARWRQIISRWR